MASNGSALPLPRLANSARRRRSLISLTPLIDVVFILLIFFMLASSFLDWRAIDLGVPARATVATPLEGALLVELRPEGIRLSGEALSLDALAGRVAGRMAHRPHQRVLVRPAPGVSLETAVGVLDRLSGTGVRSLSLIRPEGG